ncbi:SDR family oxidoreductase [Methylomagnum sp.]
MRILITGATGFVGGHITHALLNQGHEVIAAVRRPTALLPRTGLTAIPADFTRDFAPEDWLPRLAGVDAVVNCVGIIAETGRNSFDALHTKAPIALFDACVRAGGRKVVQISALGADETAFSRYHLSKKAADDFLAGTGLDWTILQPSMIYGPGGASTAMMSSLAALPVIPLIGDGSQAIQPVYVDDLTEAVARLLLESDIPRKARLPMTGPRPVTLRELLALLRGSLGLRPAPMLPVPFSWMLFVGDQLGKVVSTPLNGEALRMLQQGNTGDSTPLANLLGRTPRSLEETLLHAPPNPAERLQARLFTLLPALRITLGLLWIWSGLTSALFFPASESYALLGAVGITGSLAPLVLYGASILDILLGVAWLVRFRVVPTGLVQLLLIVGYSLATAVFLPAFWLHPFAPLAKNIPLIVATLAVMAAE